MWNGTYRDRITILGNEIARGERVSLELEVAKLHTRNSLQLPIIVNRALEDGPVLLLMGGIHGDEINGVAIVREIIRRGINRPLKGTVIAIPVFNIFGYLHLNREFPDGRDLNRVFPGSATGSLASQFAYHFTREIMPVVDCAIDFHTGGAERDNIPHIRCLLSDARSFELARAFGPRFILHSSYIPRSVREALNKLGKPALLFEGGKSRSLDPAVIESGVTGTRNLMRYLGMLDGNAHPVPDPLIIRKSRWLRSPHAGIFHVKTEKGIFVRKRTILGVITDPYGEFERKITAPHDCHIIGINTAPVVNKGDALVHVSVEVTES